MAGAVSNWTVVTGSTGGIGSEIVKILAARGDALVLVNRSDAKAVAQRAAILAEKPGATIELVGADLMDTAQIAHALARIAALPGRVDALYNISGVLTGEMILSAQGFESQFAVNTLATYQLIQGLRGKMARPAGETPAMIITFSSSAITPLKSLDVETLAKPPKVGGLMTTYAQTKLAVTALAAALADDLQSDNILIRAVDPGATKTPMTTGGNSGMPKLLAWLAPLLFSPADKQAAKVVERADPRRLWSALGALCRQSAGEENAGACGRQDIATRPCRPARPPAARTGAIPTHDVRGRTHAAPTLSVVCVEYRQRRLPGPEASFEPVYGSGPGCADVAPTLGDAGLNQAPYGY
ncbi:MAG: SDR family NAD(P)-dependent oxidoreductase [Pseudomonadota bacterium]